MDTPEVLEMRADQPSEERQPMIARSTEETTVPSTSVGTETDPSPPVTERRPSHDGTVENGHETDSSRNLRLLKHNRYATRKTAAQGMMDMALLLANASQLKSVLQEGPNHRHYTLLLFLIMVSISLQIFTGLLLLIVGARESYFVDNDEKDNKRTNGLNNLSVAMVFLITITNIFITSFGIYANPESVSTADHGSGSVSPEVSVDGGGNISDRSSVT